MRDRRAAAEGGRLVCMCIPFEGTTFDVLSALFNHKNHEFVIE